MMPQLIAPGGRLAARPAEQLVGPAVAARVPGGPRAAALGVDDRARDRGKTQPAPARRTAGVGRDLAVGPVAAVPLAELLRVAPEPVAGGRVAGERPGDPPAPVGEQLAELAPVGAGRR